MVERNLSTEEKLENFRKEEEERMLRYLSEKNKIPFAEMTTDIEPDAIRLIPESDARLAEVASTQRFKKTVTLLVRNLANPHLEEVERNLKESGFKIKRLLATLTTLERAWGFYSDLSVSSRTISGLIDISSARVSDLLDKVKAAEDIEKLFSSTAGAKEGHATRLLEILLAGALKLEASDIHLEAAESGGIVRYRVNGILKKVLTLNEKLYSSMISRLKLFSGLKVTLTDQAQDGRFTIILPDKSKVELRTSSVPEGEKESLVMRLLKSAGTLVTIEQLGLHPTLLKIFREQIKKPNGMVVTTGPTGSGKTTTLYSFLKEIYTPKIKIITLENPVEYKLPGIVQTQITKEYSFEKGLRAALRQDPDVILVGEIRDKEVASVAVNASLTGHIVFSTLHTNDASGALPRLLEMGIDSKTLGAAMNLVIAQRLVRIVDKSKSKKVNWSKKQIEIVNGYIDSMPEAIKKEAQSIGFSSIYQPEDDDGYSSRIGIFEAIIVDQEIQEIINSGGGSFDIKKGSKHQKLMTLEQDCLLKVLKGITSPSELQRTTGVEI